MIPARPDLAAPTRDYPQDLLFGFGLPDPPSVHDYIREQIQLEVESVRALFGPNRIKKFVWPDDPWQRYD